MQGRSQLSAFISAHSTKFTKIEMSSTALERINSVLKSVRLRRKTVASDTISISVTESRLNELPDDLLREIAKYLSLEDTLIVCLTVDDRVRRVLANLVQDESLVVDLTNKGFLRGQINHPELRPQLEMLANLISEETKISKLTVIFSSDHFSFQYFHNSKESTINASFINVKSLTLIDRTKNPPESAAMESGFSIESPLMQNLEQVRFENIRLDWTLAIMMYSIGPSLKRVVLKKCPVDLSVLQQIPPCVRLLKIIRPSSYVAEDLACWIIRSDIPVFIFKVNNKFMESVFRSVIDCSFHVRFLSPCEFPFFDTTEFTVRLERRSGPCPLCPAGECTTLREYRLERTRSAFPELDQDYYHGEEWPYMGGMYIVEHYHCCNIYCRNPIFGRWIPRITAALNPVACFRRIFRN